QGTRLRRLVNEIGVWLETAVFQLPGEIGEMIRRSWLRMRLSRFGARARVSRGCSIKGARNIAVGGDLSMSSGSWLSAVNGRLELGRRVWINRSAWVDASEGGFIVVGDDVMIGPNVVIRAANHGFEDIRVPMRAQGHRGEPITIGNDVWIGANAVVV